MNVLHPYDRGIPEQKDKTEEDQARKYQESDEDSLLGFNVQRSLQKDVIRDSWFVNRIGNNYSKNKFQSFPYYQSPARDTALMKDCAYGDGMAGKKFPDGHPPSPL